MDNQLFIPKTIKVGFQSRDDTYTKKLSYIIYYDNKGVLRKETSWKGWCDEKLGSIEVENTPHEGFILNKDVQRSSEWFGSGRNMIRIYDDRGFEFEITTGNLLFNLMTTDCLRRGFTGQFVYAWWGKELILLPTNCEEYLNCIEYTNLQDGKISAKSLIPGAVYETKKQEKYIYVGRYDWYEKKWARNPGDTLRKKIKNAFVFCHAAKNGKHTDYTGQITHFKGLASFAKCLNDTPVDDLAELIEKFKNMHESSRIVALEFGEEENFDLREQTYSRENSKFCDFQFFDCSEKVISKYTMHEEVIYNPKKDPRPAYYSNRRTLPSVSFSNDNYDFNWSVYQKDESYALEDGEVKLLSGSDYYSSSSYERRIRTVSFNSEQELRSAKYRKLFGILENGAKIRFEELI